MPPGFDTYRFHQINTYRGTLLMALKKLTLSVDEDVIETARRYAQQSNTSISRLVTQFLARLPLSEKRRFSPTVRRLLGILPHDVDVAEYRRHLAEKHGE